MDVSTLTRLVVLSGLACAAGGQGLSSPEVVLRDWYFRESLVAIRGWEVLLAEWEQQTPEDQRIPTLPVPDGAIVEWANPIPLTLVPPED
ncbi:MAG TPA: hypothetical protein PLQ54_15200, partial [Armatimonadota bacterium]|nr:hypothetical protein [Armatimonadota bacterium]